MNDLNRNYGGAVSGTRGVAIDEGLRQYMLGVYNYMALGVAFTGLVAMLVASNQALVQQISGFWLIGFGAIIGLGLFAPRLIFSGSAAVGHALYWAYAALWGIMIAPILYSFQMVGASQEIYRAFFIAASIFGALSLWGYTTKQDLSKWSNLLMFAGFILVAAILVQVFFLKSTLASLAISSAVVVYICAVTAWETQTIKRLYSEGSEVNGRTAILGAFMLLGSFVTLFIHILNILGIMRGD